MNNLTLLETTLLDLKIIKRKQKEDSRGYFSRLYCPDELKNIGFHAGVMQINESFTSHRGAIRGMHYQKHPWSEVKIVTCVMGAVFDVAIDLRRNSSTYLQWFGVELSPKNSKALLIPQGFAHGFQTLSDDTLLIYTHSQTYKYEADAGISPFDPKIGVQWPIPVKQISNRDRALPCIDENFNGI